MSVLVDTPIWSALFRRTNPNSAEADELRKLILNRQARLIGSVRQELLSGIRERTQFEQLRNRLRPFSDVVLTSRHYERAAEIANLCRSSGVQGSSTDFLLFATAEIERLSIFSTDADFQYIARHLPLRFHRY